MAWCVWNGNVNWTSGRLPKETAQAIFADPDMILANSTRPSGKAVVVEDGYQVTGRWALVSGCQLSAWFILMCRVEQVEHLDVGAAVVDDGLGELHPEPGSQPIGGPSTPALQA